MKSENTPSLSSANHQNPSKKRSSLQKQELLKYMSTLPSNMEKGDNLREKAVNLGVLDWRLLEKWKQGHRQAISPSSNIESSYFSTAISSANSTRGQSCPPDETALKVDEFQDLKNISIMAAKTEHNLYIKYQSFNKLQELKLKECEPDDKEVQNVRKRTNRSGKSTRQAKELENIGSGLKCNYQDKDTNKAPSDDFESSYRDEIKQSSSKVKLLFESPLQSSKPLIHSSGDNNIKDRPTRVIEISEPKISILKNHKLRKTSPNRMLIFGLNRLSRRIDSLDISSEPIHSKNQPKKEAEFFVSGTPKLRNPSPTRNFRIGLNKFSRRTTSDFSAVPKLSSDIGFRLENSSNDELEVGRKSQMSPLRRVLDPLLKPKAVSSDHVFHSLKDSGKLYPARCEPSNTEQNPSTVKALIQLSKKKGLPLFTFAIDKNSSVLAATMKRVSALRKCETRWIYTFFSVNEVKKKSGWMNKGCKRETHGYIPKVVGQMRASNIIHDPENKFSTREFVSFLVDASENGQKVSNFRPKDEVVAILAKFQDKKGSDNITDQVFSATAILPGGSHGLPSKGNPLSLLEKWKSGGLCDCGGWDLGCGLTALTSKAESDRTSNVPGTFQAAERFELFPQGEVGDRRPVFILSPFKGNVCSVEFDSSISFLQAFSICISILDCRKPYDLSELSTLFEVIAENTVVVDDVIKSQNLHLLPIGRF